MEEDDIIIETVREAAIRKLTVTGGPELDLAANLTSTAQMEVLLEMHAHYCLGSKYVIEKKELMERLTCAYQGRLRSDLVEVSKTPDYQGGQ